MKKILSQTMGLFIGIIGISLSTVGNNINGTFTADIKFFGLVSICISVLYIAFQIALWRSEAED